MAADRTTDPREEEGEPGSLICKGAKNGRRTRRGAQPGNFTANPELDSSVVKGVQKQDETGQESMSETLLYKDVGINTSDAMGSREEKL